MPANRVFVSVIIPAYNAENYIKDAIESVLNQTYSDFEIIVVDDASKDNTVEAVRSFNDERIHLIKHPTNQGPGAARNTAIDAARGKWLALLDADDQWLPHRLEKLIPIAVEAGEGYFVTDDSILCFQTPVGLKKWGSEFEKYNVPFNNNEVLDLSMSDFLKLGAPGIKPIIPLSRIRSHNLKYNTSCFFGEDFEFFCHLFRMGLKLRLCKKGYYLYRLTSESLTSRENRLEYLLGVYERLLKTEGFTQEVYLLLESRLNQTKRERRYIPFSTALKRKEWDKVFRLAIKNPWLLIEFLSRLPASLRYRLSALRLGGNVR